MLDEWPGAFSMLKRLEDVTGCPFFTETGPRHETPRSQAAITCIFFSAAVLPDLLTQTNLNAVNFN